MRIAIAIVLLFVAMAASAVTITMSTTTDGSNTPVVYGTTNLPNGTQLMVTLSRKASSYFAQENVTVTEGHFHAGPFSQSSSAMKTGPSSNQQQALNPGAYTIDVSSPGAMLQPNSVRKVIGEDGGKMQGPYAHRSEFYGKVVQFYAKVQIGSSQSPSMDNASRRQAKKDADAWWIQSCKHNSEYLKNVATKRGEFFNSEQFYQKCLLEKPKK